MRRGALVTPGLVLASSLATASHSFSLALYLLLAAVLSVSVSALAAFGDAVSDKPRPLAGVQAALRTLALALLLGASAAIAPARHDHVVPRLAVSALVACLIVIAVEMLVTLAADAAQKRRAHEPEPASAPR